MSDEAAFDTLAADGRLNSRVTVQAAQLAASAAVAVQALGQTVSALAKDKGVDTAASDAGLAAVDDALKSLIATIEPTGAVLAGMEADPVGSDAAEAPAAPEPPAQPGPDQPAGSEAPAAPHDDSAAA